MDALADAAVSTVESAQFSIPNFQRNLNQPIGNIIQQSSHQQSTFQSSKTDWHLFISLEERLFIREKIKKSYRNRTSTFEELLDTCCAIEEELIYIAAPSRLDYFKSGVQFEKRVFEKRKQLSGQAIAEGPVTG